MRGASGIKRLVRPVYHLWQDWRDDAVLERNVELKNLHEGERCFILGNGVSLKQIDLGELSGEHTFGCNLVFRHETFARLSLSFYACVDTLSGLRRSFEAMERPQVFFPTLERRYAGSRTTLFLHASCRRLLHDRGLLRRCRVHFVKPSQPMLLAREQSNELSRRMTFLDGGVFFMIAASIYMGFRELYLCGCDYTFWPRRSGHFYEDWFDLKTGRKIVLLDGNANAEVDDKHRIMKTFADVRSVRIFNVVPDGFESPFYPKISWSRVLESVRAGSLSPALSGAASGAADR